MSHDELRAVIVKRMAAYDEMLRTHTDGWDTCIDFRRDDYWRGLYFGGKEALENLLLLIEGEKGQP